jgi:hypothetical protein
VTWVIIEKDAHYRSSCHRFALYAIPEGWVCYDRECWAQAGIDLAAGLITAAELHELGLQILVEQQGEENAEIVALRHEVLDLEDDNRVKDREIDDLDNTVYRLEKRIEGLEEALSNCQKAHRPDE